MPPTVKPPPDAADSFGFVSVVMIAVAASGPPSGSRAAAALRRPGRSLPIGNGTPITPVERTSTCSAWRSSSLPASAAVASASSFAALARRRVGDAGVDDDRLRLGERHVLAVHGQARGLYAVPAPHGGADGRGRRARDREVELRVSDPRVDAGGDEALRSGDAHTGTPARRRPCSLVETERKVRVLDGLAGSALAEVVECADDDRRAGGAILEHADLGRVRALHARQLRRGAVGKHAHDRARRVRGLEQPAHVLVGAQVTRRQEAAPHGQEVGDEADGKAELLRYLGRVAVRADGVGRDVLEHEAGMGARLQRPARSRDARLGVDDDTRLIDGSGERSERQQRGGRVAARVRDQVPDGWRELREPVAPRTGGDAVPLGRKGRVDESVRAGEVDHDRVGRRIDGGRLRVVEAEKEQLCADCERLLVRDERRQRAVQTHVERRRASAGEGVRAERDDLEPGVREHTIEGLLSRVAAAPGDGGGDHNAYYAKLELLMHNVVAHLVLEDGTVFTGRSAGAPGIAAGEACFTTAMAGYEESVTDPSYVAQVLCFSYPLIGNYGVDQGRHESERAQCEGVVARTLRPAFAGWLAEQGTVALDGVDTRALVRRIRDAGVLRCALGEADPGELLERALAEPPIDGRPLDRLVGTVEPYSVGAGPRVTLVDLGCKRSIPVRLAATGLEVHVVPGDWDADAILDTDPRAVLIGNGPGDPSVLEGPTGAVRDLLGRVPLFGICLGHQLLGLALGLETFKLHFGHRGANHPVRDLRSGRVLVTVQNHGYAVSVSDAELVTHVSLNDGTVEGLAGEDFASVQFHPEAAPGPLDALSFFDQIGDTCRSATPFALS